MSYFLIPIIILGALLFILGLFILLARLRNGRYLRPLIASLSKIPWMKRQFEKVSKAAIERQNPELASAMRKLERVGRNPDPQRAQAALSQLTPTERRAYMEAIEQQGGMPEATNREMRRRQQRLTQTGRPRPGGGGAAPPKRKKR
jgi:uncharacterized protein YmfQ (DUF2313 family)